MNLREKFEFDVKSRKPQLAFKDGLFNPEYVQWLETEFSKELDLIRDGHLKKVARLESEVQQAKKKENFIWDFLCKEEKQMENLVAGEKLSGNIVKESQYKGELVAIRAVMLIIQNHRESKTINNSAG